MNKKGVTLLLAVLVSSIALSVGIGIFSLLFSEIEISGSAKDSVTAIYAADSGFECAIYWKLLANKDPLMTDPFLNGGSVVCNNNSINLGPGLGGCLSNDPACVMDYYQKFVDNTSSCVHSTVKKINISGIDFLDFTFGGENRDRCDVQPNSSKIQQRQIEVII